MAEAQQVAAAITTLLSGNDPQQRRAADTWLNSFTSQPAAWEASLQLLGDRPEVAYFAANMLLTKVRREWSQLSPQQRAAVSTSVSQALFAAAAGATAVGSPPLAARRLCLVLAAAGARSPPAEAVVFVQQALDLGHARGSAPLALLLLKALADEADEAPMGKRSALLGAVAPACQSVLQLAEQEAGSSPAALADALRAAQSWLRLDATAPSGGPPSGGRLLLSPPAVASSAPALHSHALASLGGADEHLMDAAAEFLADVHAVNNPRAEQGVEAAAALATVRALVSLTHRAAAPDGEARAKGIARVATALCERHLDAVVAGADEWLSLVSHVVNTVAARPERACMSACADMLLHINDTPVASRHPQLREPLFSALGARCVAHATLPAAWTCWDDAGSSAQPGDTDDADDVQRFREQTLSDLLQCCESQLRTSWLTAVIAPALHLSMGNGAAAPAAATSAPQWPHVEAALFVLRACALNVRARAFGDRSSSEVGDAHQERVASNALLAAVFTRIAADGGGGESWMMGNHPCVIEAACRCTAAYAMWLGKCPQGRPLVHGVTSYLLRALRVPAAVPHASDAFRNVCARAGETLSCQPEVLSSLIATAHSCFPPPPPPSTGVLADDTETALPEDQRVAVIEGLGRLVARLPAAHASAAALQLAGPFLERCAQRLTTHGDVSAAGAPWVHEQACDLGALASAIRFLDVSGGTAPGAQHERPALAVMRAAWPVLSRQGESRGWREQAPMALAALCDVFSRALAACGSDAAPLVAPVLSCVLAAFEARPQGCCLQVVASALEAFTPQQQHNGGRSGSGVMPPPPPPPPPDAHVADALVTAVARASAVTAALVDSRRASPQVVAALCEVGHRCTLFAPAALLRPDTLLPMLRVACHALASTEREPVAAGALLVRCLVTPGRQMAVLGDAWRQTRPAVDAAMHQMGRHLMAAACTGAVNCPSGGPVVCHLVGDILRAYPAPAAEWLSAVVLNPAFSAAQEQTGGANVDESTKRMFLQLALQSPPMAPTRFDALFTDWAKLCRREGDAEALLAYHL